MVIPNMDMSRRILHTGVVVYNIPPTYKTYDALDKFSIEKHDKFRYLSILQRRLLKNDEKSGVVSMRRLWRGIEKIVAGS